MKRILTICLSALSLAFLGCASSPYGDGVTRVAANTTVDLSGYWNDTDLRIVANTLIDDCTSAPAIRNYPKSHGGRLPVVIVGAFRNRSDEHIDTSILTTKLEMALVNSGMADFVADAEQREFLRTERQEQQYNASEDTAKSIGNETGADFMLQGAVKTIIDSANSITTRTYFVTAELIDIETNKKLWIGENSEIKKVIKRASTRM